MSSKPPANKVRDELGFFGEDTAAEALEVSPKTLEEYRKTGKGPRHAIVARKPIYTTAWLREWLEAGGTRETET